MTVRPRTDRPGPSRPAVIALRLATSAAAVLLGQLMAAPAASACDVSYGYKPTISLDLRNGLTGSGECSTGTSLAGVAILTMLAVAVLAAVLKTLFDRGAARAGLLTTAEGGGDRELALSAYLNSVGIEQPAGPPTGPPTGPGAPT